MNQAQAKRRQSTSERIIDELAAMKAALESLGQVIRLWVGSQGQPKCPVDDHVPEAIEQQKKPQVGCRSSGMVHSARTQGRRSRGDVSH